MFCSQCGESNLEQAKYCSQCGAALGTSPAPFEDDEEQNREFYAAAVGYKKADYYVPRFMQFDAQGIRASWQAFFVSLYWLLYRKMWLPAGLYFLLSLPFGLSNSAWLSASSNAGWLAMLYLVAVYVVLPMYANALYYRQVRNKIARAKQVATDKDSQLRIVRAQGGTSNVIFIIIALFFALALLGMVAAVAIPAYQDYTQRARVSEGLAAGTHTQRKLEAYVADNNEWPRSLSDLDTTTATRSDVISEMSITQGGALILTYRGGPLIQGKSLALIPSKDANGSISWACENIDLDPRALPSHCQ